MLVTTKDFQSKKLLLVSESGVQTSPERAGVGAGFHFIQAETTPGSLLDTKID